MLALAYIPMGSTRIKETTMENNTPVFPEMKLFHPKELLMKVGGFLLDRVRTEPRAVASDHYRLPTVLEGTYITPNRWDSMGDYSDRSEG